MQSWTAYLWVACGGALGSVGRYWLATMIESRVGGSLPWGTIAVNVSGSFVIGFLAAFAGSAGLLGASGFRLFLMVGVCGGYTTFSSFSLQTLIFLRNGEWLNAGGNILLSVVLCLMGVWLGYLAGMALNSWKAN
ncbi:MAG TPA: fluoride efflux transporter CrcB [Verrucomicrobiae bacterium]|nr:fluoride efflux transporter CrcB [Verrucomicrobiae bacterium]